LITGRNIKRKLIKQKKLQLSPDANTVFVKISLPWKGSSLTDKNKNIPQNKVIGKTVPSTYVPGRNTIFLGYALSFAEAIGAKKIFIGANAVDFSGYPDCRPKYYDSFNRVIKAGARDKGLKIETPIIDKDKADIIKLAIKTEFR